MNIIVCVDEQNGMLFGGRRQSKDRILRRQVRLLAQNTPLWMNGYSARQFEEDGQPVYIDENFLETAPAGAWCFVENTDMMPYLRRIEKVAVYRWNRLYPSDVKFPMAVFEEKWTKLSSREFAGSSHERITEEVYQL